MALSTTATVLHFADLARSDDIALGLASRMVASSRHSRDISALQRWVSLYTDLLRSADDPPM